jgi:DNA modification methylase
MPTKWTFSMQPVAELLKIYNVGIGWADPFAGVNTIAEFSNDIEGNNTISTKDALEFLKTIHNSSLIGVLFDPPYSVEQCLRRYTPKQNGTAGRAEYWAKCKDEIGRIVKPGGRAISFCWDSTGIGKKRGFEIQEIMLICHGACHNDTIVTVEIKNEIRKPAEV